MSSDEAEERYKGWEEAARIIAEQQKKSGKLADSANKFVDQFAEEDLPRGRLVLVPNADPSTQLPFQLVPDSTLTPEQARADADYFIDLVLRNTPVAGHVVALLGDYGKHQRAHKAVPKRHEPPDSRDSLLDVLSPPRGGMVSLEEVRANRADGKDR